MSRRAKLLPFGPSRHSPRRRAPRSGSSSSPRTWRVGAVLAWLVITGLALATYALQESGGGRALARMAFDGDVITGRASVVDGDTLDVRGQRIRLWGIDAPEARQVCEVDGEAWRCGQSAALALARRLGQQTVRCETRDIDRWERIVALCRRDGEDLGRWLVQGGLALAFRRYSRDYVADEERARAQRAGLWRGSFALPWEWRRERAEAPLVTADSR